MCHRVDTFLSTLSLRRATAPPAPQGKSSIFLSTLSLRRATGCQRPCARPTRDFYPRSPCGERRGLMGGSNCDRNFYPRSPCGERHTKHFPALHHILISIHALLAESDPQTMSKMSKPHVFLSTLSLRRATPWHGVVITSLHHFYPRSPCGERRFGPGVGGAQQRISIHALLAESDPWYISLEDWQTSLFLSTLSLRRATRPGYAELSD